MPATTFTVSAGATFGGIAKTFGIPLGLLIDTNGITDPNKIKVDQVLTIPTTTTDGMDHPADINTRDDVTPPPAARSESPKAALVPAYVMLRVLRVLRGPQVTRKRPAAHSSACDPAGGRSRQYRASVRRRRRVSWACRGTDGPYASFPPRWPDLARKSALVEHALQQSPRLRPGTAD
ncbi:MAG: LysM peptidoglycan-binding domain-containing protein [Acidobacteria bacterium]|nr:LysM peptidoglycan-binding domain-containing protein [Acidobacteriota bacterium]